MHQELSRPRRPGAVLVLAVLIGACADGGKEAADYGGYINGWVGKPVAQLTADWGRPSYETEDRGMRELQYNFSQAVSYGERPIRITCSTKFLVDGGGIVREALADGNACSTKNSGPQSRWK